MALTQEKTGNFFGVTGTPLSNTVYDELDFGFKSRSILIVVSAGTLEISLNNTDSNPHLSLPVGSYPFDGLEIGKLWVRQIGATITVAAWTN